MKNIQLPFEHGRTRSMFLYIENRKSIIDRTISVEMKVAIISEVLFGRLNEAYEDFDEPESDFYSSNSSSTSSSEEDENDVDNKKHHHHHHHTHTLRQGVHAAIVFKRNGGEEKYRKACVISSINVDSTIDVIISHPHHHKHGKKEKRSVIKNVVSKFYSSKPIKDICPS